MKTAAGLVTGLSFSVAAFADKYGIDEAMSESTGGISDIGSGIGGSLSSFTSTAGSATSEATQAVSVGAPVPLGKSSF